MGTANCAGGRECLNYGGSFTCLESTVSNEQKILDYQFKFELPTPASVTTVINTGGSTSVFGYSIQPNGNIVISVANSGALVPATVQSQLETELGLPSGSLSVNINTATNTITVASSTPSIPSGQVRTPASIPVMWLPEIPAPNNGPGGRCVQGNAGCSCATNPCICIAGFSSDGTMCNDINECNASPCQDGEICSNYPGGKTCLGDTVSGTQIFFDNDFTTRFPTVAPLSTVIDPGAGTVTALSYEVLANSSIKITVSDASKLTDIALLTTSLETALGYPSGSLTVSVNPATNEVMVSRIDPSHQPGTIRTPANIPTQWVTRTQRTSANSHTSLFSILILFLFSLAFFPLCF
jgi:hypothetical protein